LRKLLTVAVAATATLALAAGAIADPNDSEATLTVKATPTDAGTAKNPKNVKLAFKTEVDKPKTTVGTIDVLLPKGIKFSGKGLKKCNAENLQLNGTSACPAGSKAGLKGTSTARIEPAGTPLDFNVYPFVGGDTKFLFYLVQTVNGVESPSGIQTVLTGKITNRGRKLTITVPFELRQPAQGLNATLTSIHATFVGKVGKHYVVTSTNCKGGKWNVKGSLVFATRSDNAPVPASESLTDAVKCKK